MNAIRRFLLILLVVAFATPTSSPVLAGSRGSGSSKSTSSAKSTGRTTHVRGYYRKDGTYVQPHERRLPGAATDNGTYRSSPQSTYIPPASTPSGDKIEVKGYFRKDGTWVAPYLRSRSIGLGGDSHLSSRPTSRSVGASAWKHQGDGGYQSRAPLSGATFFGMERDKHGRFTRRASARSAFMRMHPCPSTGRTSGPCPGYVVDHIKALKRGGADHPSNMQWQTVEAAKAKDAWE